VWDVTTRTPQGDPLSGEFPDANIYAVSFDLDGRRVIAGSSDGTVRVWDVALHKETTAALSQDQNPVSSLALANKSPWIATGGASGLVRVWDMVNDPPAGTPLDGHRKWVHSVAISPDDRLILSGSADGTLQLWPGPAKMRDVICSKLATNVSHKQWDEWVAGKVSYEAVCQGLDPAPDG
jgi:WD40 repeat protein